MLHREIIDHKEVIAAHKKDKDIFSRSNGEKNENTAKSK